MTNTDIHGNPFKNENFYNSILLFLILFASSTFVIYEAVTNIPFIKLGMLIIGTLILIFSISFLYLQLKRRNIIKITPHEILLVNFLGKKKVIKRDELNLYFELRKKRKTKNGFERWFELIVTYGSEKIKIVSKDYPNYEEIKENLINNIILADIDIDVEINKKKELLTRLRYAVLMVLLISSFPFLLYTIINHFSNKGTPNAISGINGKISEIDYLTPTKSKIDYATVIKIEEYPYFSFEFRKEDFMEEAMYEDLKKHSFKGNKITIYISFDEFSKKISKKKQISFFEKYFNYNRIETYGIKDNYNLITTINFPKNQTQNPILSKEDLSISDFILFYGWIGILAFSLIYANQKWDEYRMYIEDISS